MQMAREQLGDYFMTLNVPSFIRPVFVPYEGFEGFFRKRLRGMFGVIQAILPHRVTAFPDDSDEAIGRYTVPRRMMRLYLENIVRFPFYRYPFCTVKLRLIHRQELVMNYRKNTRTDANAAEFRIPSEISRMMELSLIVFDKIGFHEDWLVSSVDRRREMLQSLKDEADVNASLTGGAKEYAEFEDLLF